MFVRLAYANNRETVRKMNETGHMDDKISEAVKYIFAAELEAKKKQMAAKLEMNEEERRRDRKIRKAFDRMLFLIAILPIW